MDPKHIERRNKLADALQAASAINEELLAYERNTPGATPSLAFAPLNAEQVGRWREHTDTVLAGERTRGSF